MPERASVFEAIQIGLEATAGSEADAGKKLEAYSISPQREGGIETFTPEGSKFPTLVTVGKEHTVASVEGILDYANIVYPLASLIQYGTANITQVGTTAAYTWTFKSDADGPDTTATYTVEKGSSVRAEQFEYGTFTGFGFSFKGSDSQVPVSGEMIGTQLRDGITMTATPATVDAVPVNPKHVTVKLATTEAGLAGATALDRLLAFEWNVSGKQGPVFTVGTADSFVATVETMPEASGSLTLEANSGGMAYLVGVRAGTQYWMRFTATGPIASATTAYSINIDMPILLNAYPPLEDSDGVVAAKYGFVTNAAGTANPINMAVVNTLTAL